MSVQLRALPIRRFFYRAFVQYGAGAGLFASLERTRYANTVYWALIAFGVSGWILIFLAIHQYTN